MSEKMIPYEISSPKYFEKESANSNIDHPNHYGGDTVYEAIKVIEAWDSGFHIGNVIKYLSRAGKKDPGKELEDLKKALWYLSRYIDLIEEKK